DAGQVEDHEGCSFPGIQRTGLASVGRRPAVPLSIRVAAKPRQEFAPGPACNPPRPNGPAKLPRPTTARCIVFLAAFPRDQDLEGRGRPERLVSPTRRPERGSAMIANDSFAALMEQLRSGEDEAAREVFRRFARQLVGLARRRVAQALAHHVDPEDVVQSAFKSFFVRQREGKFRVASWNSLWGLLTLIPLRKWVDRVEYLRAERRDVGREVRAAGWQLAPDREPRPQEAAILAETIDQLWRAADADERPVLELSLEGH